MNLYCSKFLFMKKSNISNCRNFKNRRLIKLEVINRVGISTDILKKPRVLSHSNNDTNTCTINQLVIQS